MTASGGSAARLSSNNNGSGRKQFIWNCRWVLCMLGIFLAIWYVVTMNMFNNLSDTNRPGGGDRLASEWATSSVDLLDRINFSKISIGDVEAYWDSRPCNLRHSDLPLGSKEYFQEVEQKKYFVEPHIPRFADFPKWRGKRVLEIGCGLGTESINFVRHGADLTIVELSGRSLELTKKRFEVFGLKATFIQGNAEELEKLLNPDIKFDLIWSFGVIHHTPHPERVIAQMRKFIQPEGQIRIMLYSRVSYKLFFLMKQTGVWDFAKAEALVAKYSEAQTGSPVTHTYSFEEARKLLQNNFEIRNISKDHIFPYKIEEYVKRNYVLEDCWKNVSPELFREYEKELGWHTLIIAAPIKLEQKPRSVTVSIFSEISKDEELETTRDRLKGPLDTHPPSPISLKRQKENERKFLRDAQLQQQGGEAALAAVEEKIKREKINKKKSAVVGLFDRLAEEDKDEEEVELEEEEEEDTRDIYDRVIIDKKEKSKEGDDKRSKPIAARLEEVTLKPSKEKTKEKEIETGSSTDKQTTTKRTTALTETTPQQQPTSTTKQKSDTTVVTKPKATTTSKPSATDTEEKEESKKVEGKERSRKEKHDSLVKRKEEELSKTKQTTTTSATTQKQQQAKNEQLAKQKQQLQQVRNEPPEFGVTGEKLSKKKKKVKRDKETINKQINKRE